MEDTLCISRLKSMRKTAKKAEARLIDTVMCHISDMDNCTISSLAAEAGVSYATVCRLLEKIGVSGFKEFKKVLSSAPKKEKKEEITPDNLAICDRVCTDSLKMVENCKESLKNGVLDRAVEALSNAGTVMFTGLGASAVAARYAYIGFLGILPQCFFSNDMIMAKMKASLLNKGDVLFAVSSSGKTKPVTEAAKIARSSGAAVISLTDGEDSPLSGVSDIVIDSGAEGENYYEADIPLIQGQITAINVLYTCVYKKIKSEKEIKGAVRSDKA